ncbi:autotransporter strand-loop-strand O-heptosyltransferase [Paraburkholderia youngii]|uniref:autotransporter strand-loop-strand O-heptosyltransferase n=1 Tax=Paraburkholderia youngii TaxID=2782701 RepID=UPI003D25EC1A
MSNVIENGLREAGHGEPDTTAAPAADVHAAASMTSRVLDHIKSDTAASAASASVAQRDALASANPTPEPTQIGAPENTDKTSAPATDGSHLMAPAIPTQTDIHGIAYDFNDGVRVMVPAGAEGEWVAEFRDAEHDQILFRNSIKPGTLWTSRKRYFTAWNLKVWKDGQLVLDRQMKLEGKKVLVQFPMGLGTLGDFLGWLPFVDRLQKKHKCRLTAMLPQHFIDLVGPMYPDLLMVPHEKVDPAAFHATYRLGLFFGDVDCTRQPSDFRYVGLHRTAGYILGVDPTEEPPKLYLPDESRPIAEKYVVIATKASTQCKYWNHVNGWREIIKFLKDAGYRVICIDKEAVHGTGLVYNHLPHGCEDETGDRTLAERARWIKHADFFIGLSSGLSWLAWAVGQKNIVMISGFTHPNNEFHTPYRVINFNTCNSCWNDPRHSFDHKDFLWCPRHAGTDRQFECTKLIAPGQVMNVIRTIPSFAAGNPRDAN